MSDAVNEAENLDVMSSVRRKISTGKIGGRNKTMGVDKLVLTASLRVDGSNNNSPFTEKPILAEVPDFVEMDNDQPANDGDSTPVDEIRADANLETEDMDKPADDSPVDDMDDREILTSDPSAFNTGILIDEDTLRDMISDIVRQELQGDLGEKITRNVRKLVRREIHRTMVSNELS